MSVAQSIGETEHETYKELILASINDTLYIGTCYINDSSFHIQQTKAAIYLRCLARHAAINMYIMCAHYIE